MHADVLHRCDYSNLACTAAAAQTVPA